MTDEKLKILEGYAPTYRFRMQLHSMVYGRDAGKVREVESFLKEIVEKSDFSMCVRAEDFEKIVESDRVKSMFETGHGTSNGGVETRREWVRRMYGVNPNSLENSDFPKYGVLTGKNKVADLARDPDLFYHYGSVMLTLRKENFIDRTTMTVGSSFNFDESLLKSPTFVKDPKALCIKGFPTDPTLNKGGWFNGLMFFYDMLKSGKLSVSKPNCLSIAADDMPGFENYELQFHGEIVFSHDVESVTFFPLQGNEEELIAKVAPKLDALGIRHDGFMSGLLL